MKRDKHLMQIVGHVIKKERVRKEKTQQVISDLIGMDRTNYIAIETGKHGTTIDTLFKLCEVLHIRPGRLIEEIDMIYNYNVSL